MWIMIFLRSVLGENPSYLCSGCSKPYTLGSFATVGLCPSGYTLSSSTCNPSSSLLFSLDFSSTTSLIKTSVNSFSVESGSFSTTGNPFPTVSRGFYFPSNSFLKNSQLIPSPDLTLELWVRVLTDGYIFGIKGTSSYLALRGKDSIYLDYRYCASNFICSLVSEVDSRTLTPSTPEKWKNVRVQLEVTGMTTMTSNLDLNYEASTPSTVDGQNAVFNEVYSWTFGMSISGFSGFIYKAIAFNTVNLGNIYRLYLADPPICDPGYFYDEGSCTACPGCTNNGWCVRSTDCSICLSNTCSSCSGYSYDDCNVFTSDCSDGCISCESWNKCNKCRYGYIIRDEGWAKYCEEDLRIILISTTVSDFVVSGADEYDQYMDYTSNDDPKPVAGRGYYFTSKQFLTTKGNFLMPNEFMIYMWVLPLTAGTIISKGSTGITDTNVFIDTKNIFTGTTNVETLNSNLVNSIWNYHVVRVHFTENLNIDVYGTTTTLTTFKDLARNDLVNTKLILGNNTLNGFSGYLAYVGVASIALSPGYYIYGYMQTLNLPFGSQLNPCLSSNTNTCDVTCTSCDSCFDLVNNFCYNCPVGYYHSQTSCPGPSSSSSVVTINSKQYSVRGPCLQGGKGLGCLSCFTSSHFYLYENLCIMNCPTGYSLINGICKDGDLKVFVQSFKNLFVSSTFGSMSFGSDTVQSYPYLDVKDPIPVYNRGFYFKSNSYISVSGLFFGPEMSISIWVFVVGYGDFYYKKISGVTDNFKLNINSDGNTYFNMNAAYSKNLYFKEPSINLNVWKYITIKISYEPVEMITYVELYYQETWKGGTEFLYDFFEEDQSYPLILGSDKGYGFTGFMYMVIIYSTDWDFPETINYLGCGDSPETTYCLEDCLINQRFDSNLLACVDCDQSCTNGCVKSSDCVTCLTDLCATCTTVDATTCSTCKANSVDTNGKCECVPGYVLNANTNTCEVCPTNTLYFTNYQLCITADKCPGISPAVSSLCTMTDFELVYFTFQSYSDTFTDSASQIKITTGSDSSFYPSYSSTDPWMIPSRGFYFSLLSYVSIDTEDKIILAPEFTIGFWIKPQGEGIIFERSDGSSLISVSIVFCTGPNFYDVFVDIRDSNNQIFYSEAQFVIDTWKLVEILVGRNDQGRTVAHSGTFYTTVESFMNSFKDSTLPKSTKFGFFTGFAWDFVIYNFWHPLSLNQQNGPIGLTGVLSNCLVDQYDPDCLSCDTSCSNGCIGSGSCSLCSDPLCYKCSSSLVCNQCYGDATFNQGICSCPNGFDNINLVCSQVICSDPLCNTCSSSTICTQCHGNATLSQGSCSCPNGFDAINLICFPIQPSPVKCFSTCLTCEGSTENQCLTCVGKLSLLGGTCIECPNIFWNMVTRKCQEVKDVIFYVKFSGFDGVLYDTIQQVPVVTGLNQSFYPLYDIEDPFATIDRGFYFNGINSVVRLPEYSIWTTPKLIMPLTWTLEIWVNFQELSGCLFSWTSDTIQLFSLCLNSSHFSSKLSTTSIKLQEYLFPFSSNQNIWKQVSISFTYANPSVILLKINNVIVSQHFSTGFIPNYLSKTTYTLGKAGSIYLNGFMYQVTIYSYEPETANIPHSECEFALSGKCIPSCGLNQFWVGPGFDDCSDCLASCQTGCKNNDSCLLCSQDLCSVCQNTTSTSCLKCVEGAELSSTLECSCLPEKVFDKHLSQCVECKESQYFYNETCFNCSQFCQRCNQSNCLDCIENAYLEDNTCKCLDGFAGSKECARSWFTVKLKITSDNEIFLHFSQELKTKLTVKWMEVTLAKSELKNFQIEKWSQKSYKLILNFREKLQKDSTIIVKFKKNIFSVDGSELSVTGLEGQLESDINPTAQKMKTEAMEKSVTITISFTAVSIGLTFANPNPSSLWSFISTVQMLCFIRLLSIDLPPKFEGYLEGLKKYNLFPNIFEYFVPHSGGKKPYDKAFSFGYTDHLILFNVGNFISAFLSMLVMFLIIFLLSLLTKFKPLSAAFIRTKIENSLKNYKFGNFLRFWITCYMDVYAASLIGLITTATFSLVSVVNLVICCVLIIVVVSTPVVFFYYSTKNKDKIEQPEVQANWGTLFYEFNNDQGMQRSLFYFFYFIRRVLYISVLTLMKPWPIVQISLNIVNSAFMCFYVIAFLPFSEKILNISNGLSEFCITLLFTCSIILVIDTPEYVRETLDEILVSFIHIIMGIQMLSSLIIFVKTVHALIKMKKAKRNIIVPSTLSTISVGKMGKEVEKI